MNLQLEQQFLHHNSIWILYCDSKILSSANGSSFEISMWDDAYHLLPQVTAFFKASRLLYWSQTES